MWLNRISEEGRRLEKAGDRSQESKKSTRLVQAPEASERDSKLQEWARDRVGRKMRYLEGWQERINKSAARKSWEKFRKGS